MRKKWLCVDGKCIYAMKKTVKRQKPPYPTATFTIEYEQLQIYCKKKHNYIREYVTSCRDFQNTQLV
jgi:hypothetical protein